MRTNSVATRQWVLRSLSVQAVTVLLISASFLFQNRNAAIAAGAGGMAVLLGNALASWVSLAGNADSAGMALARVVVGLLLKWAVVFLLMLLAIAKFRLPALPLLIGFIAAVLSVLVIGRIRT